MNAIDRLLTNGGRILEFLKEFTTSSAKDVSITYINADNSESVKTFPNIAKQLLTFEEWKNNIVTSTVKVREKIYGRNEVFIVNTNALIDVVRVTYYDFSTFILTATLRHGSNGFISARVVMSRYGTKIYYDSTDSFYGVFEGYVDADGFQRLRFKQNSDSLNSVEISILPIAIANGGNTYYIGV